MSNKLQPLVGVLGIMLLGLFAWLPLASAAEFGVLYVAKLPVDTQQSEERTRKAREGLEQVVIRITGNTQSVDNPLVQASLIQPDQFLQQFNYFSARSDVNAESESTYIKLQFDPALVDRLLRQARLPIWGSNRPNVLVWVIKEDVSGRGIVSAGEQDELKSAIVANANVRGLPVIFPLMDLTDEVALTETDAWGLFRSSIETASQRYNPEGVLAGRVYQTADGDWIGRWLFIFNGQSYALNSQSDTLTQYPQQAIDWATNFLANYYAVDTSIESRSQINMWVTGISTLKDYAQVTDYLDKFAVINQVRVARVVDDRLLLNLTADGGAQKLAETIALDSKLIPATLGPDQAITNDLIFRWQP